MNVRRLAAVSAAVFAGAAVTGAALGAGGDDGGGTYRVRAIFDNASFVIAGEDVKVSGVNVGTIDSLDVDAQHRAVVVLNIDDPAFRTFRADAKCAIRLQSLIGEQFVQCEPTQPRGGDRAPAPALAKIKDGEPGAGQYLLPVDRTQTPVGVDLLNDIVRVPEQQRLPLIINELGAGLSGNGEALQAALRRASPALQQADELVAILARQNVMLGKLADDSDKVLGPFAEHRKDLTGFVKNAGEAGTATARQGDAFEASLAKLPGFLRELGPATDRLGAFADQTTPAIDALAAKAPAVNEAVERLGPLTQQARRSILTLGDVADKGRATFPKIDAVVSQLKELGVPIEPLAANLGELSKSFDDTGGIESLMRFIYFYTGAVNGEDASGHYTRAGISVGACATRTPEVASGCPAKFYTPDDATASAARAKTSSTLLGYLLGGK
jgi:phospholipid/cholesterol/gamma-HCH transport system substrate-binding protein